jgi:predicted DNA-binding transcriptional regulator YafY
MCGGMARNDQVSRILRVITQLELNPDGISVRDLHQRLMDEGFRCSMRTVYRDLEAVQAAHFPVTNEGEGENGRWRLNATASISRNIKMSYHEVIALFLARESLETMKGGPLYEAMMSFFEKLDRALDVRAREGLRELSKYMAFRSRATWHSAVAQEVLDTIHNSCEEQMVLEIEYRAASGENKDTVKTRRVGPEAIYFADAGAYLIAKDLANGLIKSYALARIRSATMTEDPYQSEGFDLEEFLKGGIGVLQMGEIETVELFIEEPIASYISERRWHDSQHVVRVQGGVQLKMDVRLNDELARWILGLGPSATVKAPAKLVRMVAEMATQVGEKYRTGRAA